MGRSLFASLRAWTAAALLSFTAPVVQGQAPGTLDLSFDTGSTVNGAVRAVAPAGNGKAYVGGDFTSVSGAMRNGIARLHADGTADETFNPGTGVTFGTFSVDGTVTSVVIQADGKLLIGGDFNYYNGAPCGGIARLNSDGSLDPSFNPGAGADFAVYSVALQTDGKVLIGGFFRTYNDEPCEGVARLKSDGSLDTTFRSRFDRYQSNGTSVYSIAVQGDGKMIIGGEFTHYGSTSRNGIARLNSNGSLDTSFNSGGGGANSTVYSVAVQADGKVLIGGSFTSYLGTPRNSIARVRSNGSLDPTFNPGTGADGSAWSVALQADGKLLIGGAFTNYNGTPRNRITRLNSNGSLDTSFDPGNGADGSILSVAVQADETVLIGGGFTSYNGTPRNRIARLNGNGSLGAAFSAGGGANGPVNSIATQADGKMLIGGSFTSYSGTPRNSIVRIHGDGSLDPGFDPGTGASSSVNSIAVQADGKLLIGGAFTSYNGLPRNRIARLNGDGSLDASFAPGTGASSSVSSIAVQADGKLLIGGSFTSYNGSPRNRIARLNGDGSLDTAFNPGSGASSSVNSIALQADGKVLIGGAFTSYNGSPRNRIARLNGDGSLDTTFNPGTGADNIVSPVAVLADGKMLIGGAFASYNGTPCKRLARLNSDGSLDASFAPGTGASSSVNSIAVQADGKLLIGGSFTSYNGSPRNRIARLNGDGSLDPDFVPGTGTNDDVLVVAQQADGKVLLGGVFGGYNGTARSYLTRVANSPAAQTLSVPSASQVKWFRGNAAPEIEQVTFDCSADGTSWSPLGAGTRISDGWELTGPSLADAGYLRAQGRAISGRYNGSSSVIEQVVSYATPTGMFDAWTAAAGLTGPDAEANVAPHGDGVPNVLKYAFNMNASSPDTRVLVPGSGTAGLPVITLAGTGPERVLRVEYLRRKGSGLIYTPKWSGDLSAFTPFANPPAVTDIDTEWERAIAEEPAAPATRPQGFAVVEVEFP